MRRRDVLISIGSASVGGAITATPASAQTDTAVNAAVPPIGPYTDPWDPSDPDVPGRRNIAKMPDDYFTPGRFAGKTVLVTGCARGMGAGAAWRLAREGANVVGVDWLEAEGRATMEAIAAEGHATRFVAGDVGEDATCARMIEAAVEAFGGIDAALNNAGVMDGVFSGAPIDYAAQKDLVFAPIHEATEAYWDNVFRTNVKGTFLSMRHELRQMLSQGRGGSIVNVASIAGLTGLAGNPAYVASKHAVNGITRNAAVDYAPYGIRVNSVNMAATDTPMIARAGALVAAQNAASGPGPAMGRIKTQSILAYTDQNRRPATVAEQVGMMCYLLSPESGNMTGTTFATDGGWTAY
jgi:NAD(P)-dependent dehydrogenase (short-subunit alcohol dehydrogenase family)